MDGPNKVYFFTSRYHDGGFYIAAKTWKEARRHATCHELADDVESFIDYKGHVLQKGKLTTEHHGVLNLNQMQEIGLLWFECSECGSDQLKFPNDEKYVCKCGHEDEVPYVDL